MKEEILKDIEKINMIILACGSLGILLFLADFTYFLSFALGSAIMSLNFRLLKAIILGSFSDSKIDRRGLLIKLPLKFLGLLLAISLIVIYCNVHVIYFVLGISTVFLSIILVQIPFVKVLCEGGKQNNGA